MNARGHHDALDAALAVTREIHACMEAGEWGRAASLESERRRLLDAFFAERPSATELSRILTVMRELIASNDTLIGIAEHQQRKAQREADTVTLGRRALRAYGDVA